MMRRDARRNAQRADLTWELLGLVVLAVLVVHFVIHPVMDVVIMWWLGRW